MLIFDGSAFHVSLKIEASKYGVKSREFRSSSLGFQSFALKLSNLMSFGGYFPLHIIAIFRSDKFYNM